MIHFVVFFMQFWERAHELRSGLKFVNFQECCLCAQVQIYEGFIYSWDHSCASRIPLQISVINVVVLQSYFSFSAAMV